MKGNTRTCVILLAFLTSQATANPIRHIHENFKAEPAEFMFNSAIVILLLSVGGILAGRVFSAPLLISYILGLTIGLMTLDEINLELIAKCGNPKDRAYAAKIIPIRKDGYFLLVSLLLANTVA